MPNQEIAQAIKELMEISEEIKNRRLFVADGLVLDWMGKMILQLDRVVLTLRAEVERFEKLTREAKS